MSRNDSSSSSNTSDSNKDNGALLFPSGADIVNNKSVNPIWNAPTSAVDYPNAKQVSSGGGEKKNNNGAKTTVATMTTTKTKKCFNCTRILPSRKLFSSSDEDDDEEIISMNYNYSINNNTIQQQHHYHYHQFNALVDGPTPARVLIPADSPPQDDDNGSYININAAANNSSIIHNQSALILPTLKDHDSQDTDMHDNNSHNNNKPRAVTFAFGSSTLERYEAVVANDKMIHNNNPN